MPELVIHRLEYGSVQLADVQTWINPEYIKPTEQRRIKRLFAAKSELSLAHFLNVWAILTVFCIHSFSLRNTRKHWTL